MNQLFKISSGFAPAGDQPFAIDALCNSINEGNKNQVLLGVTGSGKTFTMANIIERLQRPAIIMAPNKTLAAQLYGEMKSFFPENAVEYFVSYYDYYQPEAYVPSKDLFIEKDSSINEQIDRLRHAATRALFERRDCIIVASVSSIYGLGSKEDYMSMRADIKSGEETGRDNLIAFLVELQYSRNDISFERGSFRVRGDIVELFPTHMEDRAWRFSFFGDEIEKITEFDPLTGEKFLDMSEVRIYANSHYITPGPTISQAVKRIKHDLKMRLDELESQGKLLEAQRLDQRTKFDIEMLEATGMCSGIENYSRYLTGRAIGEPPPTLIEYLPPDALMFLDESHVMVPQLRAMYNGDFKRKSTLVDYGFRLPAAKDNRPLKFEEWDNIRPQTVFISATPSDWEQEQSGGITAEQVVRPTGLIDPPIEVRPCEYQVDDLMKECQKIITEQGRILVTTLTKKMAEALTEYLEENSLKVRYMHSDVDTLERIEIIHDLRKGEFDILVGINLLREGLDIPECKLVAILDADKEGYLRSKTSLIQTSGRAARNSESKVIMYADKVTKSMSEAISEMERRREKQIEYNLKHGIIPKTITRNISDILDKVYIRKTDKKDFEYAGNYAGMSDSGNNQFNYESEEDKTAQIAKLRSQMLLAAENLEFEEAAKIRDIIKKLSQ